MEPTLTRNRAVQTRLSETEADALERLAYQEGCTVAYFLRRVILKQILLPSGGSNGSHVERDGVSDGNYDDTPQLATEQPEAGR